MSAKTLELHLTAYRLCLLNSQRRQNHVFQTVIWICKIAQHRVERNPAEIAEILSEPLYDTRKQE